MNYYPRFQTNRSLKEFSTFGIGGAAKYFIEVKQISEMCELLSYCECEKLPFFILGKGSNSLFDDRGFDGLVILNKIAHLDMNEEKITVGAGYSFSLLGAQTSRRGFSGLEFASGIPASVGGAIYMNAGANGQQTADCLQQVDFVNEKGILESFSKEDLQFSYRVSSFQQKKGAIVSAVFSLKPCQEARTKQISIIKYRKNSQPYGEKSAGCVFRNPSQGSAGQWIEKIGLKEETIGGAQVSSVHANFIINKGNASAKDVLSLAEHVKKRVHEKTGIELELEIRCIPYQIQA